MKSHIDPCSRDALLPSDYVSLGEGTFAKLGSKLSGGSKLSRVYRVQGLEFRVLRIWGGLSTISCTPFDEANEDYWVRIPNLQMKDSTYDSQMLVAGSRL